MSQQERLKQIQERVKAQKEKEKQEEALYFTKITSGPLWKIFEVMAWFCVTAAIILGVETFIEGKVRKLSQNEYLYYQGAIVVDGDAIFTPYYEDLAGFDENSFEVIYSPIFGDAKFLSFESVYSDSKTPETRTKHVVARRISIYSYFPFLQLVLLIPIVVYLYKRPNPIFKFGRMLCFLLIFPASLYFVGARIFMLF